MGKVWLKSVHSSVEEPDTTMPKYKVKAKFTVEVDCEASYEDMFGESPERIGLHPDHTNKIAESFLSWDADPASGETPTAGEALQVVMEYWKPTCKAWVEVERIDR